MTACFDSDPTRLDLWIERAGWICGCESSGGKLRTDVRRKMTGYRPTAASLAQPASSSDTFFQIASEGVDYESSLSLLLN